MTQKLQKVLNKDDNLEPYKGIVLDKEKNKFLIISGPFKDKKDFYLKMSDRGYIVRKVFEAKVFDWIVDNAKTNIEAYLLMSTAFSKWRGNNMLSDYYVKLLNDIPQLNREKIKGNPNTRGKKESTQLKEVNTNTKKSDEFDFDKYHAQSEINGFKVDTLYALKPQINWEDRERVDAYIYPVTIEDEKFVITEPNNPYITTIRVYPFVYKSKNSDESEQESLVKHVAFDDPGLYQILYSLSEKLKKVSGFLVIKDLYANSDIPFDSDSITSDKINRVYTDNKYNGKSVFFSSDELSLIYHDKNCDPRYKWDSRQKYLTQHINFVEAQKAELESIKDENRTAQDNFQLYQYEAQIAHLEKESLLNKNIRNKKYLLFPYQDEVNTISLQLNQLTKSKYSTASEKRANQLLIRDLKTKKQELLLKNLQDVASSTANRWYRSVKNFYDHVIENSNLSSKELSERYEDEYKALCKAFYFSSESNSLGGVTEPYKQGNKKITSLYENRILEFFELYNKEAYADIITLKGTNPFLAKVTTLYKYSILFNGLNCMNRDVINYNDFNKLHDLKYSLSDNSDQEAKKLTYSLKKFRKKHNLSNILTNALYAELQAKGISNNNLIEDLDSVYTEYAKLFVDLQATLNTYIETGKDNLLRKNLLRKLSNFNSGALDFSITAYLHEDEIELDPNRLKGLLTTICDRLLLLNKKYTYAVTLLNGGKNYTPMDEIRVDVSNTPIFGKVLEVDSNGKITNCTFDTRNIRSLTSLDNEGTYSLKRVDTSKELLGEDATVSVISIVTSDLYFHSMRYYIDNEEILFKTLDDFIQELVEFSFTEEEAKNSLIENNSNLEITHLSDDSIDQIYSDTVKLLILNSKRNDEDIIDLDTFMKFSNRVYDKYLDKIRNIISAFLYNIYSNAMQRDCFYESLSVLKGFEPSSHLNDIIPEGDIANRKASFDYFLEADKTEFINIFTDICIKDFLTKPESGILLNSDKISVYNDLLKIFKTKKFQVAYLDFIKKLNNTLNATNFNNLETLDEDINARLAYQYVLNNVLNEFNVSYSQAQDCGLLKQGDKSFLSIIYGEPLDLYREHLKEHLTEATTEVINKFNKILDCFTFDTSNASGSYDTFKEGLNDRVEEYSKQKADINDLLKDMFVGKYTQDDINKLSYITQDTIANLDYSEIGDIIENLLNTIITNGKVSVQAINAMKIQDTLESACRVFAKEDRNYVTSMQAYVFEGTKNTIAPILKDIIDISIDDVVSALTQLFLQNTKYINEYLTDFSTDEIFGDASVEFTVQHYINAHIRYITAFAKKLVTVTNSLDKEYYATVQSALESTYKFIAVFAESYITVMKVSLDNENAGEIDEIINENLNSVFAILDANSKATNEYFDAFSDIHLRFKDSRISSILSNFFENCTELLKIYNDKIDIDQTKIFFRKVFELLIKKIEENIKNDDIYKLSLDDLLGVVSKLFEFLNNTLSEINSKELPKDIFSKYSAAELESMIENIIKHSKSTFTADKEHIKDINVYRIDNFITKNKKKINTVLINHNGISFKDLAMRIASLATDQIISDATLDKLLTLYNDISKNVSALLSKIESAAVALKNEFNLDIQPLDLAELEYIIFKYIVSIDDLSSESNRDSIIKDISDIFRRYLHKFMSQISVGQIDMLKQPSSKDEYSSMWAILYSKVWKYIIGELKSIDFSKLCKEYKNAFEKLVNEDKLKDDEDDKNASMQKNESTNVNSNVDVYNTAFTPYTNNSIIPLAGTILENNVDLNTILFDNDEVLREDVRKALLNIASLWYDSLDLDIVPVDIYLTGSNANYNYTDNSDIDLHLVFDYENAGYNVELLNKYFIAAKKDFNTKYNIQIKGIPVEVGCENINAPLVSTGIYSIANNKWITMPKIVDFDATLDFDKYNELTSIINSCMNNTDPFIIKTILRFISKLRKFGLRSGGEYSNENLLFKKLRDDGYITKLRDIYNKSISKELSLESDGSKE